MKVPVYMLAFCNKNTVREVEIDDSWKGVKDDRLLEEVFRLGQNDFQPKQVPSVSVGDVAKVGKKFYLCKAIGWGEVTREWFDNYMALPQTARRDACLEIMFS